MTILIDTHSLLWFLNGDKSLSQKAKEVILSTENLKYVSIASIWEIAVKMSLGKLNFPGGLQALSKLIYDNGFELLPLEMNYFFELLNLKFIHKDPFDRILISQCTIENIPIVTNDQYIKKYKVKTIW